jgi:hypothetical protein
LKVFRFFFKNIWGFLLFLACFFGSWIFKDQFAILFFFGKTFNNRSIIPQIGIISVSVALLFFFSSVILLQYEVAVSSHTFLFRRNKKQLIESACNIGHRFEILTTLLAVNICLINVVFPETIPFFDGRGWDGVTYTNVAQHLSFDYLSTLHKNSITRIFPSTVIHLCLTLFNIPLTIPAVIHGFQFYNSVILILGSFFWGKIGEELALKTISQWLMCIGFFLNFCVAKFFFYYPTLTDQNTIFLGILLLFFYLKKKPLGVFITGLIGFFTWPYFYIGALFFLTFPRNRAAIVENAAPDRFVKPLALIISLSVLILAFFFHYLVGSFYPDLVQIIEPLVPISFLSTGLLVYLAAFSLLGQKDLRSYKDDLQHLNLKWLLIGSVCLLVIKFIASHIGDNVETPTPIFSAVLVLVFQISLVRPLNSIVSHFVYFGPIVILIIFFWKKTVRVVSGFGTGMVLYFLFYMIQFLVIAESREVVSAFPIFLALAVKALDSIDWNYPKLVIFIVMSLLISRCWLPINGQNFYGPLTEFPYQMYFMNFGPWMSNTMFLIFLGCMVAFSIVFFALFKKDLFLQ